MPSHPPRRGLALLALALALAPFGAGAGDAPAPSPRPGGEMILATTTSTQDSGLLDVLVPRFEAQSGTRVKVIAVGSGAALAMAGRGDADAVLTHAPGSERPYVERGEIAEGRLVMYNDFVIVGPPGDPAQIDALPDIPAVMRALAAHGSFVSRGDESGTHARELELWRAAGIDPTSGALRREESGQGMGATLQIASQKGAYTLSDRATFLALAKSLDLAILVEGDPPLLNVYRAYLVDPVRFPRVQAAQARAFLAFLVAPETQAAIADFGRAEHGQSLFSPAAGQDPATLGH